MSSTPQANPNLSLSIAKFGTTPENLARGRDILSRDQSESSSDKRPSNEVVSKLSSKPAAASGLFASNATAFPPMCSTPPKPLSQGLSPKQSSSDTGNKTLAVDYGKVLRDFFKANAPEKLDDVVQYLEKYHGKEDMMFVGLAKKYSKPNALNEVFLSRVSSVDKNDYLALLTLYLQVFNPSRAGDASNYVLKYKVCDIIVTLLFLPLNTVYPLRQLTRSNITLKGEGVRDVFVSRQEILRHQSA